MTADRIASLLMICIADPQAKMDKADGGFQRLRMFVRSGHHACKTLRVLFISPNAPALDAPERLQNQLLDEWGVKATVRVIHAPAVRRNRVNSYLLPVVRADVHPDFARFATPLVQAAIQQELDGTRPTAVLVRGPGAALAYTRLQANQYLSYYDIDDIGYVKFKRMVASGEIWGPAWLNNLQYPQRRSLDRKTFGQFTSVFVCSEHDRAFLQRDLRCPNVEIVSNGSRLAAPMELVAQESLLFVGNLKYGPNATALRQLLDRIMPLVWERRPETRLLVAGDIDEELQRRCLVDPRIEAPGFVEDLDAWYRRARVVVCPLTSGGGTRIKLIEAAMRAKPIVSTRLGAEGLGLLDGKSIWLVELARPFADACIALLGDDATATRLGKAAREHVVSHFSTEAIEERAAQWLAVDVAARQSTPTGLDTKPIRSKPDRMNWQTALLKISRRRTHRAGETSAGEVGSGLANTPDGPDRSVQTQVRT